MGGKISNFRLKSPSVPEAVRDRPSNLKHRSVMARKLSVVIFDKLRSLEFLNNIYFRFPSLYVKECHYCQNFVIQTS